MNFECKDKTLVGKPISVGKKLVFKAVDKHMEEYLSSDIKEDWKIISVVPSLDTGVCSKQTRTFNKLISQIENTRIITISCDLPFAQSRYCGAEGIDRIDVVSDYKYHEFGHKTNLFIKSAMLLTRAVLVLNKDNVVTYIEVCEVLDNEPVYDAVLKAIEN